MASYLVSQGYALVNDAYRELVASATSPSSTILDSTDVVTMGKTLAELDLLDGFYGKITNKITKTVAYVLSYKADGRQIIHDAISWGAFIERVYVDHLDAVETPSFKVSNVDGSGDPNYGTMSNIANPYGVTATYKIDSKIFGGSTTWSLEFNTDTHVIRKAFRSEADMMAFIDAIFVKAQTDIELQKEALVNLAVNTGIAAAMRGGCVRNLLAEYNTKVNTTGADLTAITCLRSADFLKWANMEINRTIKLMSKPSSRYNPSGYLNASSRDAIELEILSQFADASKVYLESGTYHDDKVAISGTYREIPFWQFNSEDFADASKVSIKNTEIWNDGATPPVAVELTQTGVIGVARDKDSVAAIFENNYQWSMPNPRARINSYGYDFERGYAVEPHANFVVFVIADVQKNLTNVTIDNISNNFVAGNEVVINITMADSSKSITAKYNDGSDHNMTAVVAKSAYKFTVPSGLKSITFTQGS